MIISLKTIHIADIIAANPSLRMPQKTVYRARYYSTRHRPCISWPDSSTEEHYSEDIRHWPMNWIIHLWTLPTWSIASTLASSTTKRFTNRYTSIRRTTRIIPINILLIDNIVETDHAHLVHMINSRPSSPDSKKVLCMWKRWLLINQSLGKGAEWLEKAFFESLPSVQNPFRV
jgi:hypothetical protein